MVSKLIPRIRFEKDNSSNLTYQFHNLTRAYRSWFLPYIKSRFHNQEFSPVLSFFYTDLNCNLDCPYCFSKGKKIPGMSMEVAKDGVDWLYSTGCKVLAYMGGEPLVRKEFIIDITSYAVKKGFFVYLPTNGILFDMTSLDNLGRAGISAINLAVDAVDGSPDLPKNFNRIKKQFEYLVERKKRYGYLLFFNINITHNNLKDVKILTRLAHDYDIGTDYHICEMPPIDYETYDNTEAIGCIKKDRLNEADELIDWLIEKCQKGYPIVNSVQHLRSMKLFIRGDLPVWPCKAGEKTMVIRIDGSFVPCMELLGSKEDWGNIYDGPKFDPERLSKQKETCSSGCLSTCNYQVYHYTQSNLYSLQWVAKHAFTKFLGVS